MADQFKNARLAFVKVGSDVFAAEEGSSISIVARLIETTNKSDTAASTYMHDIIDTTASANGMTKLDDSDGSIETLSKLFLTNIQAGTAATLIFVMQALAPTTTITASALVTEWTQAAEQAGVIKGNYAFQITGTLTVVETAT